MNLNKFWIGVISGFIIPPITLYIIYLSLFKTISIGEFINLLGNWNLTTDVFIWSIIPVFIVFSVFYFKKFDEALKGIVLPTLVYTMLLVFLNF